MAITYQSTPIGITYEPYKSPAEALLKTSTEFNSRYEKLLEGMVHYDSVIGSTLQGLNSNVNDLANQELDVASENLNNLIKKDLFDPKINKQLEGLYTPIVTNSLYKDNVSKLSTAQKEMQRVANIRDSDDPEIRKMYNEYTNNDFMNRLNELASMEINSEESKKSFMKTSTPNYIEYIEGMEFYSDWLKDIKPDTYDYVEYANQLSQFDRNFAPVYDEHGRIVHTGDKLITSLVKTTDSGFSFAQVLSKLPSGIPDKMLASLISYNRGKLLSTPTNLIANDIKQANAKTISILEGELNSMSNDLNQAAVYLYGAGVPYNKSNGMFTYKGNDAGVQNAVREYGLMVNSIGKIYKDITDLKQTVKDLDRFSELDEDTKLSLMVASNDLNNRYSAAMVKTYSEIKKDVNTTLISGEALKYDDEVNGGTGKKGSTKTATNDPEKVFPDLFIVMKDILNGFDAKQTTDIKQQEEITGLIVKANNEIISQMKNLTEEYNGEQADILLSVIEVFNTIEGVDKEHHLSKIKEYGELHNLNEIDAKREYFKNYVNQLSENPEQFINKVAEDVKKGVTSDFNILLADNLIKFKNTKVKIEALQNDLTAFTDNDFITKQARELGLNIFGYELIGLKPDNIEKYAVTTTDSSGKAVKKYTFKGTDFYKNIHKIMYQRIIDMGTLKSYGITEAQLSTKIDYILEALLTFDDSKSINKFIANKGFNEKDMALKYNTKVKALNNKGLLTSNEFYNLAGAFNQGYASLVNSSLSDGMIKREYEKNKKTLNTLVVTNYDNEYAKDTPLIRIMPLLTVAGATELDKYFYGAVATANKTNLKMIQDYKQVITDATVSADWVNEDVEGGNFKSKNVEFITYDPINKELVFKASYDEDDNNKITLKSNGTKSGQFVLDLSEDDNSNMFSLVKNIYGLDPNLTTEQFKDLYSLSREERMILNKLKPDPTTGNMIYTHEEKISYGHYVVNDNVVLGEFFIKSYLPENDFKTKAEKDSFQKLKYDIYFKSSNQTTPIMIKKGALATKTPYYMLIEEIRQLCEKTKNTYLYGN